MKQKTINQLIAITTLLSIFVVKFPTLLNIQTIALYISAILGYSGLMLLLWNFVIGTRSVASLLSNDFCGLIKTHNWIGKYGSLFIFAHPILITLSYGESLFYSLIPNFSSRFNIAVTYGRTAFFLLLIVWLCSAIIKGKISYRPWKYLHFAAYAIAPFALLHIPDTGSSYAAMIGARIYFFIVVMGFFTFALLRLRGMLNLNRTNYTVVFQQEINPGIFIIQLKPKSKYFISPKLGQYIYIKLSKVGEDHPFTILDYNPDERIITVAYKVYGAFTTKLSKTAIDSELLLSGPFGNFTKHINTNPVVYIAAGIGITPFVSRIFHETNKREQWLFFSNRNHESTIFNQEFKSKLGQKYIPIYSREDSTPDGETGHIRSELFTKYLQNPKQYNYYICGPEPMVQTTIKSLRTIGVNKNDIHYESFNL